MKPTTIKVITFSPTHTSYKVCESIAKGIAFDYEMVDLTLPKQRTNTNLVFGDELVIIGMPVYAGRVVAFGLNLLKQMKGNNTPVVIAAIYGNRHYDDALMEMYDTAKAQGFIPIFGAACIGEHSFNTDNMPIGEGRPNAQDLNEEYKFGEDVRKKWDAASSLSEFDLKVPGTSGKYKTGMPAISSYTPMTKPGYKEKWADCAKICPTAAMYIKDDNLETNPEKCILCMACVKGFPEFRYCENADLLQAKERLYKNCAEPRKNEFFL